MSRALVHAERTETKPGPDGKPITTSHPYAYTAVWGKEAREIIERVLAAPAISRSPPP